MKVFYENSEGEQFDLSDFPTGIKEIEPLFEKSWEHTAIEKRRNNKSILSSFHTTKKTIKATISIFADTEEEYKELLERFFEVTEKDVLREKEGRLWVGNHYLKCFITASTLKEYDDLYNCIENEITITAFYPFWISETETRFESMTEEVERVGKRYNRRYAYRYGAGEGKGFLNNPHYGESHFKLKVYGPVINPLVTIGENRYLVSENLGSGEYITIDSREETIEKIDLLGNKTNLFHAREKGTTFFQKIKEGRNTVTWTGRFDFDITLYTERSVPRW